MGPMRGGSRKERTEALAGGEMRFEEEQNGGTGVKWGGMRDEGKVNGSGNVAPMFRGHGPLQMIPRRMVVLLVTWRVGKFGEYYSEYRVL